MVHTPTPEEAEQVFFALRWWREFCLALIGLISAGMMVKKGRNMQAVPIYLTDTAIKDMLETHQKSVAQEMQLCKLTLETQMRKEFYNAMRKNNGDLIERFKELLDAHK